MKPKDRFLFLFKNKNNGKNQVFSSQLIARNHCFYRGLFPESSIFFTSIRYLSKFLSVAAAARVEAERSCAIRNTHYQQFQQPSIGSSTGLSWLGTSAPKASVFAPPPGSTNPVSQSNPWTGQVDKSPAPEQPSRFPVAGSPVKLEGNKPRTTTEQVTPSVERSENLEGSNDTSEATGTSTTAIPVSDHASNASQNSFHSFTNPTKEEGESRALPQTPTSGVSSTSLAHQHQPVLVDVQGSSEQQPSSSSLNVCQLPQSQSIPNNQQIYQQPNSMDMKQESFLASTLRWRAFNVSIST